MIGSGRMSITGVNHLNAKHIAEAFEFVSASKKNNSN